MGAPILYADVPTTGWRNVEGDIQAICAAAGLGYARSPGANAPMIRWRGGVVDLQVSVNITGSPAAVDFRAALGQTLADWRCGPFNEQIPAALTGSAGVVHWAPNYYVQLWSAGKFRLFESWPAWSGRMPLLSPGVPM